MTTQLSASLEDYMEVIYHISEENSVARAKEIAERLAVSRASVTEALKTLCKKGLINYAPYAVVTLTESGREAALDVVRRHRVLKEFFMKILAVDEPLAEKGACRLEHAAPPEIIDRLIAFVEFLEAADDKDASLIDAFARSIGGSKT